MAKAKYITRNGAWLNPDEVKKWKRADFIATHKHIRNVALVYDEIVGKPKEPPADQKPKNEPKKEVKGDV